MSRSMLALASLLTSFALGHPASAQCGSLLFADFDDEPTNQAIATGGPAAGEPVAVEGGVTAIVRPIGVYPTPSLEIADASTVGSSFVRFQWLGDVEITGGVVEMDMDLDFGTFDAYSLLVREKDTAAKTFLDLRFDVLGNIVAEGQGGVIGTVGAYDSGVSLHLTLRFDMDLGTYDILIDDVLVLDDEPHGIGDRGIGSLLLGVEFDADTVGYFNVDNLVVTSGLIFCDGFETGDAQSWSASVP